MIAPPVAVAVPGPYTTAVVPLFVRITEHGPGGTVHNATGTVDEVTLTWLAVITSQNPYSTCTDTPAGVITVTGVAVR
jgi:hypothetical protein